MRKESTPMAFRSLSAYALATLAFGCEVPANRGG